MGHLWSDHVEGFSSIHITQEQMIFKSWDLPLNGMETIHPTAWSALGLCVLSAWREVFWGGFRYVAAPAAGLLAGGEREGDVWVAQCKEAGREEAWLKALQSTLWLTGACCGSRAEAACSTPWISGGHEFIRRLSVVQKKLEACSAMNMPFDYNLPDKYGSSSLEKPYFQN